MEMGKLAIGLFETGESDRARSAALDGDLEKIPPHAGAPALRCRDTGVAHSGKSRPNGGVGGEKLVADHVVSGLQVIIAEGGGAVGNTGWAVLIVERTPDGAIFDLSHRGVEVARCFLAITPASEQRLWGEASAYPTLPGVRLTKPGAPPWLAVGLLPDGMVLLGNQPDLMLELGDFERGVAWALLEMPHYQ